MTELDDLSRNNGHVGRIVVPRHHADNSPWVNATDKAQGTRRSKNLRRMNEVSPAAWLDHGAGLLTR